MSITKFQKMHGLGNDFIVLNALHEPFDWTQEKITALANRFTGIGFDQLLLVEPAPNAEHDFAYRIFNADGGEVEHCGNGARCFGKFLREHHLFAFKRPVKVAVKRGSISITYCGTDNLGKELYRVDMGIPDFTPFSAEQSEHLYQPVTAAGKEWKMGIVSMGNPHAVVLTEDILTAPVVSLGTQLQHHRLFPHRVNVGFMQYVDRQHIRLRVFERGVGETQACGTGACAAVAVGIARGLLDNQVEVCLPGGQLSVGWSGYGERLYLTGPAETVFYGHL